MVGTSCIPCEGHLKALLEARWHIAHLVITHIFISSLITSMKEPIGPKIFSSEMNNVSIKEADTPLTSKSQRGVSNAGKVSQKRNHGLKHEAWL